MRRNRLLRQLFVISLAAAGLAVTTAISTTVTTGVPGLIGAEPAGAVVSVPPLVVDAPSRPVVAGGQYTARVLLTARYTGRIGFRVTGLPIGSSAQLVTLTSRVRELRVGVPSDAAVGIYQVRFRTTNAGRVRSDTFTMSVTPAVVAPPPTTRPPAPQAPPVAQRPDFVLQMDASRIVRLGDSTSIVVRVIRQNGWIGPVRLILDGLPSGVIAGFLPVNPTSDATSDLRLVVPSNTAPGDYSLRITGRAGDTGSEVVRETAVLLRVRGTESVALAIASGGDIGVGQTARVGEIEATVVNGDGPVTLGVEGLPAGISVSVTQNPLIGRTPLNATVAIGVPVGVVNFTIIGSTTNATTRVAASLRVVSNTSPTLRYIVTPVVPGPGETLGYGLSASAGAISAPRGGVAQLLYTVFPRGGFNQPIDFTVNGLPSGVAVLLEPTSVANVIRLTVSVPSTQPVGSSTIVMTGVSGSLSAAVSVPFTVT
jgi:hypothetical protein